MYITYNIDTTTDLYLDGLSRLPLSVVCPQVWTIYGFYVIKLYRFVSHWCIYKPVASNNEIIFQHKNISIAVNNFVATYLILKKKILTAFKENLV